MRPDRQWFFTAPNSQIYTDVFAPANLTKPLNNYPRHFVFTLDLPVTEHHYPTTVIQYSGSPSEISHHLGNNGTSFGLVTLTGAMASTAGIGREPTAKEELRGTHIQSINCDAVSERRLLPIFRAEREFSAGWSHINDAKKALDFNGLKQPLGTYAISSDNLRTDASCNGEKTYNTILVKKLHTWNNTHANGLETSVDGVPVSQIESLVVELKLNSARSVIPSQKQIRSAYPRLTQRQLRNLDKGLANIDLVFSSGELRSNKVLTIDPVKYADQWIRITIPMEKMNYYREVDYKRTYTTYQAAKNHRYTGLIINAESQSRKTVQHLMDGKAGAVPLFKELDVSIRRIDYVLK